MITKRWRAAFAVLIGAFLIEVLCVYVRHIHRKSDVEKSFGLKLKAAWAEHQREKKRLTDDFEQRKYQATGTDVFERIYNRPDQDITDLIQELSREALPEEWKVKVQVEEFTNFILLIQTLGRDDRCSVELLSKELVPLLMWASPYLKNIAVFDKTYRCYLYFDEDALNEIQASGVISGQMAKDVGTKGGGFTKLNSARIDVEVRDGHVFVPVTVSSESGYYECPMLLDTGASMTVISLELAQKTRAEDLNVVARKQFHTAKGEVTCPIVRRKLSFGCIDTDREVAVSVNEALNLLGVDVFAGKSFLVDASSSCIYIWGD